MGKQIQVRIRATGKHHMEGILPNEFIETCDVYQASGYKHNQPALQVSNYSCLLSFIAEFKNYF